MKVENADIRSISIKDKILGGRAKFNGIYFFASDCIVVCRDFTDGFKVTKTRSNFRQGTGVLTKIPFVRSLLKLKMLVKLLLMTFGRTGKAVLLGVLFLSILSDILFLLNPNYFYTDSSTPSIGSYRYLLYFIIIFLIALIITGKLKRFFYRFINLFRYHGAEHKAINAALNDEPLTVKNIKNQSRISSRCGTTLVVIYLPLVLLMNSMIGTVMFLNVIFSLIIAMEVFTLMRTRFFSVAFKPVLWVSGLIQYLVMTREPTDQQLQAAAYAVRMIGEEPGAPWEERTFYTRRGVS